MSAGQLDTLTVGLEALPPERLASRCSCEAERCAERDRSVSAHQPGACFQVAVAFVTVYGMREAYCIPCAHRIVTEAFAGYLDAALDAARDAAR